MIDPYTAWSVQGKFLENFHITKGLLLTHNMRHLVYCNKTTTRGVLSLLLRVVRRGYNAPLTWLWISIKAEGSKKSPIHSVVWGQLKLKDCNTGVPRGWFCECSLLGRLQPTTELSSHTHQLPQPREATFKPPQSCPYSALFNSVTIREQYKSYTHGKMPQDTRIYW